MTRPHTLKILFYANLAIVLLLVGYKVYLNFYQPDFQVLHTGQVDLIENRLAGMDCNPYLCIAASLAAGYLGLTQELWADKSFRGDAYEGQPDLPQGLGAALDLFDSNIAMHEVLGPEFARVYSIVKRAEYEEFLQVISPWEREHLLLNV